jgi:hypothetical protein
VVAAPLAAIARRRLRRLVEAIAAPATPADLRDLGVAIAALSDAVERLELYDERHHFHRSTLERWVADVRALLELVGEPAAVDDERREAARIYWRVRESILDELSDELHLSGVSGVELSVGAGGGLYARLAALEAELDQAREVADAPVPEPRYKPRELTIIAELRRRVERRNQPDTIEELDLAPGPVRGYVRDLETLILELANVVAPPG